MISLHFLTLPTLIFCLYIMFGIHGTALSWFKSYLTNNIVSVIVQNSTLTPSTLVYHKILFFRPLLDILYILPLSSIISLLLRSNEFYADDPQLYVCGCLKEIIVTILCTKSAFLMLNLGMIYKSSLEFHVILLFHSLHWLPVYYRIKLRVSSLWHVSMRNSNPRHLSSTHIYSTARNLHSSSDNCT